ncbi:histidine phosphatase family protein [Streptomyces sp. YIM 98790]|uniref:histidine phosphatase family protein n=1 Tax=Streptomyces sp. YIM 98790 TaxID=2689077 RepID=UPI00140D3F40|nr:histidine phosphatase family protein [Streptomyces sp. YIM 98790]
MPTLLLVRHGRTDANSSGLLAGRAPGVGLDEHGTAQAARLPRRLAEVPLAAIVHSPLQRCRETVTPLSESRPGVPVHPDERIAECDYGEWTGRPLSELAREPLMQTVQRYPSAAVFPGGESLRAMQNRAVDAVREWDARIAAEHGADAAWLACSHGDIIKCLVADALGLHLDLFQRIGVGPGSVTVLRYTAERPFLLRLGDTGDLSGVAAARQTAAEASAPGQAAVGGGA